MSEPQPTPPSSGDESFGQVVGDHPVAIVGAFVLGAVITAIGIGLFGMLSDSDEAPIRVRNGSLDLYLLSGSQEWEPSGNSGNYKIKDTVRYKEEFDVTVVPLQGGSCSSQSATGPDIVLTYSDNREVRMESAGKHTAVKPGNGVTLTLVNKQLLSYKPEGGYLQKVAVGSGGNPPVLCTFTGANQLDRLLILNVP